MFNKNTFCRPGEHNLSFPVLIVQISASGHVQLPDNGAVTMKFDIAEVCCYNIYHLLI